jgi:hypothetical protein
MLRLIGAVVAVMLFSPSFSSAQRDFTKYKAVEAYEVRPGILMIPTYSADGQVCQIGLEVLHYSPDLIRLDSDLSRTEVEQILEEIIPESERGPRVKDPMGTLIMGRGVSMITNIDFEHVSLQIYSKVISQPKKKDTFVQDAAALIRWKDRECQKP